MYAPKNYGVLKGTVIQSKDWKRENTSLSSSFTGRDRSKLSYCN